jgi:cell division protein FtsW (lipid II flippase)
MGQPVPDGTGAAATPAVLTRRGTELVMLAFAAVIVTSAFILVEANQEQTLTRSIVYYGLAYLGLFAVAHGAVRYYAPYADPLILPCVALLNGLGLVMIHRLDLAYAERAARNASTYSDLAPKQLVWTTIGLAMFIAVLWLVRDHRTLARYGYTCGMAGLFLLILPGVLPASISEVNGAKLWIIIGPVSIQPGEFAKILVMVFLAAFLVAKRDLFMVAGRRVLGLDLPRGRDMGPLLFAWGLSVGVLTIEHELGASLLVFGFTLVMLYIATERAAWLMIGLLLFSVGCVIAYKLFLHVQQRVTNWIDPFATYDKIGGGYQVAQSLFSLGTGGVFGTGLGAGRPDLIPVATTDFIISGVGEETGFIGLAALLLIYALLAMRGLRTALAVRDTFGKLLAGGMAFAIGLQVFIVVGGLSKLIPQTGLTAPFMSAGGSSLLANYILVAILMRISDAARRPPTPARPRQHQAPIAEARTELVERPS